MTKEEIINQPSSWFKGKQYLITKTIFREIGIERNFVQKDNDYFYVLSTGDVGGKVPKSILTKMRKDADVSHSHYIKQALSEGKTIPIEVLTDILTLKIS